MNKNDQRKALGKGLHSLLPPKQGPAAGQAASASSPAPGPARLPIHQVNPNPNQPRRDFDETALSELKQSISRDGVLQPLLVRKTGDNVYQIIAGERRWRAARDAGLTEIPAIVRDDDDQQTLEISIVENIQREDLNAIELASAFERMADELGLSHEEIGRRTGKDRVTVSNSIRLLQLPAGVQSMVVQGQLSAGHARALLKLADDARISEVAKRAVDEGWSVRQMEKFTADAAEATGKPARTAKETAPLDPNVKAAVVEMESALATRVRLVPGRGAGGRIEIEYYSDEDLNRIYELISGKQ
jgi:ParB family chromosome partitioning protein